MAKLDRSAISTSLLQGFGVSHMVVYLHERNTAIRELILDYDDYVLEVLHSLGVLSLADVQSPETPGLSEAMSKLEPGYGRDPLKLYLLPLSASIQASYYFGTEVVDPHSFYLMVKATEAYQRALEAIPFLDEKEQIRRLRETYPDAARYHDKVLSNEFQSNMLTRMIGL